MPQGTVEASWDGSWNRNFKPAEYWPRITGSVVRRLRRFATELERTVFEVIVFLASSDGGNRQRPEGWTGGIHALTRAIEWWTTRRQKPSRIRDAVKRLEALGVLERSESEVRKGCRSSVTLRWFPGQSGPREEESAELCGAANGDTASPLNGDTESREWGHSVPIPCINRDPRDLNKDGGGLSDLKAMRARAKADTPAPKTPPPIFSNSPGPISDPSDDRIRKLAQRVKKADHLEAFVGVKSLSHETGCDAIEYVLESIWPPPNIERFSSATGTFVAMCRQAQRDGARPKTELEKKLERAREYRDEAYSEKWRRRGHEDYQAWSAEVTRLEALHKQQTQAAQLC